MLLLSANNTFRFEDLTGT